MESVIYAALIALGCYTLSWKVESQRATAPRQSAPIEKRVDLSNLSTLKRTAQPVSSSRPANVAWQKARLPQHRKVYGVYDFMHPQNCLEGGVAQYHNLRLIGHKDAVELITKALNEVWADSEARALAQAKPLDVHCIKLADTNYTNGRGIQYGYSHSNGTIAVDPFKQNTIHTAGTIYHELLHDTRGKQSEDEQHQWILPLQDAFVARRQRG